MKNRMMNNNSLRDGTNIRKRILFPLILTLIILLASFTVGVSWLQQKDLEEDVEKQFRVATELFTKQIISDVEVIKKDTNLLINNARIQRAFLSKDRKKLLDLVLPLFKELQGVDQISHFYFHDEAGVNFLRVHKPGFYGDIVDRKTMQDSLKSGGATSGIELGPLGNFTLRVVSPWLVDNEVIGYIEMGKDSKIYMERLKNVLNAESYLFISKTTALSNRAQWERTMKKAGKDFAWDRFGAYVLVEQSMETAPSVFTDIFAEEEHPALAENNRTRLNGKHYHIGVIPVYDVTGKEIGDLAVLIDITGYYNTLKTTLFTVGIISLITGILLFLFFYIILGRVERRLKVSRRMEIARAEDVVKEKAREEYIGQIEKQNEELELRTEQLADAREAALNMMEDANEARLKAENAETALRKSEASLANAQQIAHMGNWDWDITKNKIFWSDEVYRTFGLEPREVRSSYETFLHVIHPDDRELVQMSVDEALQDKKPYSIDHRIVLPDGTERIVHEQAEVVFDKTGKPVRMAGTIQDITERREAEREIKSLAKFPAENPFPVMQISSDGIVLYANEASKPILDVWGVKENRLLPDMESFIAGIYAEEKSMELEVGHGDQIFSITLIPIQDSNYIYAYGLDITGRKEAECALIGAKKVAETASIAKSEFLANMSHEIRTPMTSILGMAELLDNTGLDEEQKDYVEKLIRSGDSLISIINDVLDISKIEAGRIELEEVEFDLLEEIEKIMSVFVVKAIEKRIVLEKEVDPSMPHHFIGDPVRFRQVLVNLIGNAIKFTEKGKVTLNISCEQDPKNAGNCKILISVRDTGIGIAKEKLGVIFEKFSQADASTTRLHGGTGLGLAISRNLVEMMGGEVWAENEAGQGSTFHFTVSMKIASKPLKGKKRKKKTVRPEDLFPMKILLVDDAEDNRLLVKTFLKDTPYTIDEAENGETAFEMFTAKEYDLVLMDMQMPVMDGFEATKIIRKWESEKGRPKIPIVAFTAHALKEEMQKCLDAGCTSYLAKPVKKDVLLSSINGTINGEQDDK